MSQSTRSPKEILNHYLNNVEVQEISIQKLKKHKRTISIFRLVTVLVATGICWYFWPDLQIFFISIGLFSIIFIYLVFRDADKTAAINNCKRRILINRHETDAMQQNLHGYENGQFFAEPDHAYAADLDLFGPASLYQYLNRCHADQSKKKLADYLKAPNEFSTIKNRQDAAKELSEKQSYCQHLQSTAMSQPITDQTEKRLKVFMDAPSPGYENAFWKWFQHIYPLVPIAVSTMFIMDVITLKVFLTCLTGLYFVSVLLSRKIRPALEMLLDLEPEMHSMQKQFLLIENEKFNSNFLQTLQDKLKLTGYPSTSASIADFNTILKKNDWRSNMLINLLVQIFFVWDLRLIILLNDWKKKNQQHFKDWFAIVAEMEVMISVASLVYNEPEWCFPEMDERYFHFEAKQIGHPLLSAVTRIASDFTLEGTGKVALITGSNMAGKSTFLRSLGVNTVLALMGGPVCARQMNMSNVKLISSMRVSDNLAENTSTFYAELKKMQRIIEMVNRKERVFILLDEVLRGTNSTDRHKGSKALVTQLLRSGAVAVMATHDTDLAHSESANLSVFNYHFEGKIQDEELFFDYKIKKGISESLNATTLMKKIGIHFQD
jgi:DNA mismatch repair ATPase MutS